VAAAAAAASPDASVSAPAKRFAASHTRPTPTSRPSRELPSQEEIKAAFDAGEYRKTIQLATRALVLKPGTSAAAAYDRYELLMMRGEAYLHLKQNRSAGDSFAQAAKETKDDQQAAVARAMQRTLKEARGTTVQRRGKSAVPGTPDTADLLQPDQREAAFRIVYDNLKDSVEPKVKAASDAHTLPPIIDALTVLADLDDLAKAGAGGDSDLAASRQELGDRAHDLIARELDRMEKDVAEIKRSAETVVEQRSYATTSLQTGAGYDQYLSIRRGLTNKDRTDLKDVMKTCEKIIPAAETIAKAASGSSKGADEIVNRTKDVGRAAQRVLDAKYEGQSTNNTNSPRR
jgi:hypothetical protein